MESFFVERKLPENKEECSSLHCQYCVFECEVHVNSIFDRIRNSYEGCDDILKDIIAEMKHAYVDNIVEVNDGDSGNGQSKQYAMRTGMITPPTSRTVHLVVEEDGSVRWYFNPDRSDMVIAWVDVIPQTEEQAKSWMEET